jgi:outer membrane lipoprotein carrier protein
MSSSMSRLCRSPVAALLLAALAALAAVPLAAATAAETGSPPDPLAPGLSGRQRLERLVERVRYEQRGIETLEARFVQTQESSMLLEPEESTGTFSYAAPDRVRWEYTSPKPISVVIDGEEMTTWYHDLDRAEELAIGRYSAQVFKYLGASGSLDKLLDYFSVTARFPERAGEPYSLELEPRYARIAKRLDSMTLWIDPERFVPVRLRYAAADGDVTEYRFEDLEINAELPADRFELHLSEGVAVKRVDLGRSR